MAHTDGEEKIVHVDYEGRTIVNVNALLRDPKVVRTIERAAQNSEKLRGKPGITFVKPAKSLG